MSWKLAIERLASATSDHFDRVEERIDELASHFGRIQDQLHALHEIISSNDMQVDPIVNGGNVVCENGLHFDQNDEPNWPFNKEMSISHDCIFGTNFELQEMSINDTYLTTLQVC